MWDFNKSSLAKSSLGGETAPDLHHADVLRVDVREAMQSYLPAHLAARRPGSLTATLTTYLKIAKFLEYAANATEQIIARADDDVWLSTSTLEAYASAILDGVQQRVISRAFIAGVFEYANWIADKLLATGWATTAPWARRAGNLIHGHGNCTLALALSGAFMGRSIVGSG